MKRAICIGINSYRGLRADLTGCVNDAHDWSTVLERCGFRVEIVLDADATRSRLIEMFASLVAGAQGGDSVVVTFSGHGTWAPDLDGDEPDRRDEAICPSDHADAGPIFEDEIRGLCAPRRADVKIVTIADCCCSGTLATFAPLAGSEQPRRLRFLPPSTFLSGTSLERARALVRRPTRLSIDANRLILDAASDLEFCWDGVFQGRANGAFTYHALQALKGLPAAATYLDWLRAIRQTLPSSSYTQTPHLRATGPQRTWRLFE